MSWTTSPGDNKTAMYYPYIFKELFHRGNRTLVNILGIAAGIALFVSISAVASAYREAAMQPFKHMGADLIVQRGANKMENGGIRTTSMRGILLPFSNQVFEPGELASLKQLPGEHAHALLLWEFAPKGFRTIMGVDGGQPSIGAVKVKQWVKEGRFPQNSDEIALEKHFAKFQKAALGDRFQVGEKMFTITGMVEIKEGPQVAAANIYAPLDAARGLFKGKPDSVNLFYLKLEDPSMLNRVKSEILSLVPGASVNSSDSFLELMGGVSLISEKFSLIVSLAGLAGAVLLIMKTMASHLLERKREIGTLKALGWTGREVRRQLTAEAFIQAVSGGILGVLLGVLICFGLGFLSISIPLPWELNPVPAMAGQADAAAALRLPVSVSIPLALEGLGLSVVIGCACGYFLGRETENMKPADILRQL